MRSIALIIGVGLLAVTAGAAFAQEIYQPTGIYAPKTYAATTSDIVPARPDYSRYQPWYVDGHDTPDSHLIRDHGVKSDELIGLSQAEKNRLHGKLHTYTQSQGTAPYIVGPSKTVAVHKSWTVHQTQSNCPGGVCPTSYSRFRRLR